MLQSTSECNTNQDICCASAKAGDSCRRERGGCAQAPSLSSQLMLALLHFVKFPMTVQ